MTSGTVFVIGAGPAAMFAARKIAAAGHQVVIFNRDIKPGGLAEYGIYPEKHHMKQGLRKQFAKILELPNVTYLGNLSIHEKGCLTLDDLEAWNPDAVVCAVGAQGTKGLGLSGPLAQGVYSAKDYVYYYNQLPPYATRDFSTGKRVGIVGIGNVMVDVARWLLLDMPGQKPEEVVVLARRGPFEVKFDKREFDEIHEFLDRRSFREELARIAERLKNAGQDAAQVGETVFPWLNDPNPGLRRPRLTFRFLSTPLSAVANASGRLTKVVVEENQLVAEHSGTRAKPLHKTYELELDNLIAAIGDVADPELGLPYWKGSYLTNPDPAEHHRSVYEVFDPRIGRAMPGHFLVGWARKASEGVVGRARLDAEKGAEYVLGYLVTADKKVSVAPAQIREELARRQVRYVTWPEVCLLTRAEEARARSLHREYFKFSTNEEMLAAIDAEAKTGAAPAPPNPKIPFETVSAKSS